MNHIPQAVRALKVALLRAGASGACTITVPREDWRRLEVETMRQLDDLGMPMDDPGTGRKDEFSVHGTAFRPDADGLLWRFRAAMTARLGRELITAGTVEAEPR